MNKTAPIIPKSIELPVSFAARTRSKIKNMFADFTLGKRLYGKPEMFLNLIEMLVDIYLEWYKDKPVLQEIYSEDRSRNH